MQVEGIARDLGRTIASALPGGLGFAVLVFDFGDGGTMAYMSNAKREQMIRALRELIDKLEKG
jgi:hypothetical protein